MKQKMFMVAFLLFGLVCSGPLLAQNKNQASGKSFKGLLAVQLWSFRKDFEKDVPGTLRRIRELGFSHVELAGTYGLSAKRFRAELDKAGLKAISMHIDFETARKKLDATIRDAKILGVTDIGVPWINSPFSKKDCELAIQVFNEAGSRLAEQGMTFFYHTHGYEFVPNEGGQGTLFDLLMAKTDPKTVKIQLDTFHVTHPGQDPAKLLQQYPGRFVSLHLKDIRKDIVGNNSGEAKDEDGRPLGQGKIDWVSVLKAAKKEGVVWYIIEDETPTVWQSIPESLKYLDTVKY